MRSKWLALMTVAFVTTAGITYAQSAVNVVQDCWTDETDDPTLELEDYRFASNDEVRFVWKQKLLQDCPSYRASIFGFACIDGKPPITPIQFAFQNLDYGQLVSDPANPEILLDFTAPAGAIPPGLYDWVMVSECADTNGTIGLDGDIDDQCGVNVGIPPVFNGPVIYGPEPTEIFDPAPAGSPAGRQLGEEGTTRPWCFRVLNVGQIDPKEVDGVGEVFEN